MSERVQCEAYAASIPSKVGPTSPTLLTHFRAAVALHPSKAAIVSCGGRGTQSLTYAELSQRVDAIASNLLALGLKRNSVVSYQLPNWWEAIAIHLAALKIGAISNPLMPFLRERDLKFMLELAETDILITPATFRGFDHQGMARNLLNSVPSLRHIGIVGGDNDVAFERWVESSSIVEADAKIEQEQVVQFLFTSGTTGEPKCVMHTSRSLLAMVEQTAGRLRMTGSDIIFMPMPIAHQGGFIGGVLLPIMLGATTVLQDRWIPEEAVGIMASERATLTLAATPFLSDIVDEVERSGVRLPDLRVVLTAGAAIPRNLVHRAKVALGCSIVPSWGMSENGFVTMVSLDCSETKVASTDGYALPLMEVRVVDEENIEVDADSEGRLQVRGPNLFSGYLKRPSLGQLEPGGWFDTCDLARMDEEGYIRITGRTKDIVIRGGENIPVVEIEQVMFRHPAVNEFAVVGMPDDRLGERICAFAVLRPGHALTLSDMVTFLQEEGVTKTYWPEHLVCIEAMPRTPTGKIQKFLLRDEAIAITSSLKEGAQNDARKTHK